MRILLISLIGLFATCNVKQSGSNDTLNKWSDTKLLGVLDAQEHRDTKKLCEYLTDDVAEVREAAGLAFASVQDSTSLPCLLIALTDTNAPVRKAALFALGFVADSAAIMKTRALMLQEKDSAVVAASRSASLIAMQRNGMLRDPSEVISILQQSKGHDRKRAADVLVRTKTLQLERVAKAYFDLIELEHDPEVKAILIRGLSRMQDPAKKATLLKAAGAKQSIEVRLNAIRALGGMTEPDVLYELTLMLGADQPLIKSAVVDALTDHANQLDPKLLFDQANVAHRWDAMSKFRFYGLLMHNERTRSMAMDTLRRSYVTEPYVEAARITALSFDLEPAVEVTWNAIMLGENHPAMRQAAYQVLAERRISKINSAQDADRTKTVEQTALFFGSVFGCGDPGLISACAETLIDLPADVLPVLFPMAIESQARNSLQPIRDMEASLLLDRLAAKRDGKELPAGRLIPFNHPIDTVRLKELAQGQQYRITTNKGSIVISTDVNSTPGSSLAFDSLVVAGYYTGKAWHRMVPNFVVQGGCPRGDGYGGMPWTLRTEIGGQGFTAGTVGLASAGRDTESCQFFITHSAAPHLDGRYTRFGAVMSGMDVVWKLQVGDVMLKVERMDHSN